MKTSRAQVEQNREKLLQTASEGFRKHGFDGIKVSDIMRGAGLTHGGFYNYFASKDDLAVQACDRQLKAQSEKLRALSGDRQARLDTYFERYLSPKNRDAPENACLFPSLASDVAHQPEAVRATFTAGLEDYIEAMKGIEDGPGREDALAILSTLVGAMVLARAVNDGALSDGILEAAKTALKAHYANK